MRDQNRIFIYFWFIAIFAMVSSSFSEEIIIKRNKLDGSTEWKYLFDTNDGSRVFFKDGSVMQFRFKKDTQETTFTLKNPAFQLKEDLMISHEYSIIDTNVFVTYAFGSSEGGEKSRRAYAFKINGLHKIAEPNIESLGIFSQDNALFYQIIKINNYFIALVSKNVNENKVMKEIKLYDKYKRVIGQYPVFITTVSLCYNKQKNAICFVSPDGLLNELSLDSFSPVKYSFEDKNIDINTDYSGATPFLCIFAKNIKVNKMFYALPRKGEPYKALLLEADASTKKIRSVASFIEGSVVNVSPFNERYVVVSFFEMQNDTRWYLYDILEGRYIPLKGMFYANPKWSITLDRLNSTPYQVEHAINKERDYRFIFFKDQALDETLIQMIKK